MVVLGKVSVEFSRNGLEDGVSDSEEALCHFENGRMNPRRSYPFVVMEEALYSAPRFPPPISFVCLSFSEVRNSHDSAGLGQDSARLWSRLGRFRQATGSCFRSVSYSRSFRKTSNNERKGHGDWVMTSSDWDESSLSDSEGSSPENELSSNGVSVQS
ncbi:hypothetical protein GBA52_001055 [Prunus armeniaca]|nr:hypothetical protein GBA52_001055 [Prunus armeniaca]